MHSFTVAFVCSRCGDTAFEVSVSAETAEEAEAKVKVLADGECTSRGVHTVLGAQQETEVAV